MRFIKPLLLLVVMVMTAASAWAFTDYATVTALPQDQNSKQSYMLISARGALFADTSIESGSLTSNCQTGRNQSVNNTPSDKRFQFLLLKATDESKGYYVYSVQTQKFITQSGVRAAYTDTPAVVYIFKHNGTGTNVDNAYGKKYNVADYPWIISADESTGPYNSINVCCWEAANPDYRWCSTTGLDGGNEYSIAEAEVVADAIWKDAYDKVVAYEAAHQGGTTIDLDPTNVLSAAERTKQEAAAMDVITRFTKGEMDVEVILDLCRTVKGTDRYTYSATAEKLTVHASCAVAACRGFYDYVKAKGAGFYSWSGSRFQKPADMACDEVSLTTQFRDHQYFNVVTYGYTTPYWGKDRWRKELDWMAFHGVDMPLMLVGSEAIYRKVFMEDYGLTKEEVDKWEVGPAHLPWFRMGNLSGNSFDGPLGDEWNENQRQLAHYLLDEMGKLGMKPVCPAFGGFVPEAFNRKGTTERTGWNWVINRGEYNQRLSPGNAIFAEVGKKFMQRWEEEYGVGTYYLSDSFNEMAVPGSTATLTQYGDNIFSIIKSSQNPKAVWVTQGWTFCYQLGDWGKAKFDALTKNVDDDRFIVLYMSPEYAETYGHARDYDNNYQGFNGKGWNCTMLPNMGGKNFWTGNLNKYAKGYLNDLYNASHPGNLVGYGMTPEGVENNELLYELICDAGWTNPGKTIDLDDWMAKYEQSRYGAQSDAMEAFHNMLRQTVYNTYKDHPRFAWQGANLNGGITGTSGIGNSLNNTFFNGVETLFSNAEALKAINTPLLEAELIEAAAMYVGAKIDKLTQEIKSKKSDKTECNRLIVALQELMLDFDAALELHPTWNLKRWEDMAQACGDKDAVRNAKNARRILTVWYGNHTTDEAVQDYASRIWSGLMRDYYCPRLINQLKSECGLYNGSWNRINFENAFVASAPALSEPRAVKGDHIDFLVKLINEAKNFGNVEAEPVDQFQVSTDTENYWYAIRTVANKDNVLTATDDNAALTASMDAMESSQIWRIIATGEDTYRLESRFGLNASVVDGKAKSYQAPVCSDVRIVKADATQKTWTITPVAGTASLFEGNWTITEAPASLVAEAATTDYIRYIRRVAGYTQTEIYGQPTEPKSAAAQRTAIAALQTEAQNIDHKTYDTFLQQWNDVKAEAFTASDNAVVNKLFELIQGAHQIIVPADAVAGTPAATLFEAIKVAEQAAAAETATAADIETLEAAILAYYAAGGTITNTEVENLAPENTGWKMTITAVFPDGTEHAVYSNGTKLTAGATVPEGGVSEFDIVKDKDNTYVLRAGEQYLHIACGEDQGGKDKMSDFDGLSEELTEWNSLIFEPADASGTSFAKHANHGGGTWNTPYEGLYQIKGMCSDNQTHYFILRSGDDQWIGANSGDKFFDSNWDGNGYRTSFFRVEKIEPEGPIFPISFDEDAEVTRNDRSLKSISLTQEGGETQTFDITTTKVYNDLTETAVFEVVTGSTVSGSIGYQGNWMHGYFYIDLDGNRQLTYNVDQLEQTGTEVFSYSFWSGDLNQEQSGKNSAGQTLTGNNRNTVSNNAIALPAFVAPAEGEYNVRFKVDWNSIEPAGSSVQDIIGNGGFIIDAVLKVVEAPTGISQLSALSSNLSAIYNLSGRRVQQATRGLYIHNGRKLIR